MENFYFSLMLIFVICLELSIYVSVFKFNILFIHNIIHQNLNVDNFGAFNTRFCWRVPCKLTVGR